MKNFSFLAWFACLFGASIAFAADEIEYAPMPDNINEGAQTEGEIVVEKSPNFDIKELESGESKFDDVFIPPISPDTKIADILDVYEDESDALNLSALIENAKSNYTLQAKDLSLKQAESTKDSVIGQYIPTLDVGYAFTDVRANSRFTYSNNQLYATAQWTIFDGAKREYSMLSNEALVRAAAADKEYTQEALFLDLINAYYNYFTIKGQILATEQKMNNIAANVARIEILYNAGLETIDSLESLRAELSSTEYTLSSYKLQFEQIKLQLSLYTNMEVEKLKRDDILAPQNLEFQSPYITMQEEQAESVDHQVGSVATYWPTISIYDTYAWNLGNAANSVLYSANFPKRQNTFGVNVTWNIFNGFTDNRQKEALKLNYMALQKTIAYAKEEQKNNIKYYRKSMQTALSQIESARAALRSAVISFENVAQKFNAQLVNYNDYLDSLTTRYNAESAFIESLNNYELQKANYIFYSGQKLQDYIK